MQMYGFFLFLVITEAASIESQCPPTVKSIQPLLDKALMGGAAIVVVDKNRVVYEQGFGYDSPLFPSERQAIDPQDSIFLLASISKTFVAVAAMQMVESGRLNLDTNINEYLSPSLKVVHPRYPDIPITMRHLLMHSAGIGLNNQVEIESYTLNDGFTRINLVDVIREYFNQPAAWLPIPPGNRTSYSNPGTNLAALVIERLAGMRFEQYVQEKILKPLDISEQMGGYRLSNFDQKKLVRHFLYNESVPSDFNVFFQRFNVSQVEGSRWIHIPFHGSSLYASGYLRMSGRGLGLFLQAFLNNFSTLLRDPSSIEEMLRISPQEGYPNPTSTKYGLIWNWVEFGGRRFVGHQGSLLGVTNLMLANEKRTLGAILLTTGDISTYTNYTIEAGNTLIGIMTQLFDCFENKSSITSDQHVAAVSIWLLTALLGSSFFHLFKEL